MMRCNSKLHWKSKYLVAEVRIEPGTLRCPIQYAIHYTKGISPCTENHLDSLGQPADGGENPDYPLPNPPALPSPPCSPPRPAPGAASPTLSP
ncbi:unnamed protein product [Larinioides sclopetarius]|uniref:Uncharacterized protein n=1 Tax=Larinioides sclopetarius TaxID=280406 RepID=A0AAV2A085_9ARAC